MGATNRNPEDHDSGTVNGLGNLIVGYNELLLSPDDHTGSHNIVVGTDKLSLDEEQFDSLPRLVRSSLSIAFRVWEVITFQALHSIFSIPCLH